MSTKIPDAHKRSRQHARHGQFEPTAEPRPLTSDDLSECSQPDRDVLDAADARQRPVFAVAVREGVLHAETPGRDLDMPHLSVVYLTADGEQAVAKRVAAGWGLAMVSRAEFVDERELQPTPEHVRRFAPIVQRHPEV